MNPLLLLGAAVGAVLAVASLFGAAKATPLPKRSKILLLGDSLSGDQAALLPGTLGGNLGKLLEESGRAVYGNAMGARSASSFVRGSGVKGHKEPAKGKEQLEDAIDAGVDTAIILLGTNDLAGMAKGNPIAATIKPFKAIVGQLRDAGVEVYGIGAPHYQDREDFWPYEETLSSALRDLYGADHFIDAGPLTGNYKMHAGGKSAKAFAERLFVALTNEEANP